MELFSEIYSCYFTAMRHILEEAQQGPLTQERITQIITSHAFDESVYFINPNIASGEWNFNINSASLKLPMTHLQKAWLKALLHDRRMQLFLDETQRSKINELLCDVSPLFESDDFHYFDAAGDGDNFGDTAYITNFRTILHAIKDKYPLRIEYDSGKGNHSNNSYMPLKLNYSPRDDKFRLIAQHIPSRRNLKAVLNLSRIQSVMVLPNGVCRIDPTIVGADISNEPVVLQIRNERNALERYMLQFASMEKQTEYDEVTDSYTCRIFYDAQDETELLIRLLSFGPMVKVLGPHKFLEQIRERIHWQIKLTL